LEDLLVWELDKNSKKYGRVNIQLQLELGEYG